MKRLLLVLLLTAVKLCAQQDSSIAIPLIGINLGGQLPFGDLSQRFGPNLKAGGAFLYKTRANWLVGAESGYFFGRNIKENPLNHLKNADGFVIDNEGYPADVRVTERGFTIHAQFGKLFVNKSDGANSGLMITLGAGYMRHKINIYDAQQKVAAVRGNLKKGLDHLTAGWSSSLFLGYLHLGDNQLLNYYAGLELYQGFTKSLRGVNYNTGTPDTQLRLDILAGIRFGWILPLYKRSPNTIYYN